MLALADYDADTCSCGGQFSETSDPANEFAYEADGPYRCFRCAALAQAVKPFQADENVEHSHTLHWRVNKRAPRIP